MRSAALRFGVHEIDPRTGVLRRDGVRVALQSQPADLLLLLIERAGELVTREQIRERLWPGTITDADQNINFAIRRIRVALGPDAGLVQTVPRRGYRFVGEVAADVDAPVVAVRGFAVTRRALAIAAAVLLAAAVGFGAGIVIRDEPAGQFVWVHLVHPDRCPYIRMLLPSHWNS